MWSDGEGGSKISNDLQTSLMDIPKPQQLYLLFKLTNLFQEHVRPDASEDAEHDEERCPRGGGGGSLFFQRGE